MGTTAEKLTYLNETKGLIKDNINLTGAGLTNQTPFRQYATDLKTALLNILNNGIDTLYNNFPKTTGTGTNISLNNTLQAPIRSVINGDTQQQSYSGINILPNNITNQTLNGITFTKNKDGSLILNGTSTSAFNIYLLENGTSILNAGTYTMYCEGRKSGQLGIYFNSASSTRISQIGATESDSVISKQFTINENTTLFSSWLYITNGTTFNNVIIKPMLVKGTSITGYEPYVGGTASPNPDYPQEIKSVTGLQKVKVQGKNLLNWDLPYEITRAGNIILNNIPQLEVGQNYYFVGKCSDGTILNTSNSACVWTTGGTQTLNVNPTRTFTGIDVSGATGFYIYVTSTLVGKTITEFMLVKGTYDSSNIPEYEPYQSQEYEINLGKNLEDFKTINYQIVNQATGTRDGGTYTIINGSGSAYGRAIFKQSDLKLQPNTTYTFSAKVVSTTNETGSSVYVDNNFSNTGGQIWGTYATSGNRSYVTFTTPAEISSNAVIGIYPRGASNEAIFTDIQLEKSTQPTSYSPYFTPIHLYEGDQIIGTPYNWSIYRVNGEVVLNGSEDYGNAGLITNVRRYSTPINGAKLNVASTTNNKYSNYFRYVYDYNLDEPHFYISDSGSAFIFSPITDTTQFKTWLSTHNTQVVYKLETPITEPITNTELIEDLNNFYNAKSYNEQTNISVDGDLQMILDVSVIIDE